MKVKITYQPIEKLEWVKNKRGVYVGAARNYDLILAGAELMNAGTVYVNREDGGEIDPGRVEAGELEGFRLSVSQDESDALLQDLWVNEGRESYQMTDTEGRKITPHEVQYILWYSEVPEAGILVPKLLRGENYEEVYDFSDDGKVTRISP